MVNLLACIDCIVFVAVKSTKSRTVVGPLIAEGFPGNAVGIFQASDIPNLVSSRVPLIAATHEDVHCNRQAYGRVNLFP